MITKKFKRMLIVCITVFILFTMFNILKVYADDVTTNPNYYHPTIISPQEPKVEEKVGKILGIINVVGVIVSVVTLMVIGIKYMVGSLEEKAEYKKTMIYYLLGAALLFTVTTLPNILYTIGRSLWTI